MKIFIDIGHPAHVHYFKNFAVSFINKGHDLFFTVRDKEASLALMKDLKFKYAERGRGGGNIITKLLKLPITDFAIYRHARKFKPDLFMSFASPYAAHVSRIMRKPHISFDDTEHAVWAHRLYRPFTDVVLSPSYYLTEKEENQIFFESYMELCYLHPEYYAANNTVLNGLNISPEEQFAVIRFVSWNANHDIGQKGFSVEDKIKLVEKISARCKVFISSEGELPEELEQYRLKINPSHFHDVLSHASLYVGEGSTTATEAAILGTPAIYVNSLKVGNCAELEEKYGLVFQLREIDEIIDQSIEILSDPESPAMFEQRKEKLLQDKINPTKFMIWFVKNWPESRQIMQKNPGYQERFR